MRLWPLQSVLDVAGWPSGVAPWPLCRSKDNCRVRSPAWVGGRRPEHSCVPGERRQRKQQGQRRQRSFVAENLLYLVLNAAACEYLSADAVCRCEADALGTFDTLFLFARVRLKMCRLLKIISTILLAMKLTADCVQMHQLYKFIGHFHVSI